MSFADAEKIVIDELTPVLNPVEASTRVPNPRPPKLVRVWRTGGAAANRILDRPIITVQNWGESTIDALELANKGRSHLLDHLGAHPLVRRVEEVSGIYYDPDPGSGTDRYTYTLQLAVRAPR